jgi:hypothetical protein
MLKRSRSLYNRNTNEYSLVQNIQKTSAIYNNYETVIEEKVAIIIEKEKVIVEKEKVIVEKEKVIVEKETEIQYLKDNQVIYLGAGGFVADEGVQLKVNTVIAADYMTYITLYGVPEDGIFDQALLDAIAADAAEAAALNAKTIAETTTSIETATSAVTAANAYALQADAFASDARAIAERDALAAADAAISAEQARLSAIAAANALAALL